MNSNLHCSPEKEESPCHYADRLSLQYAAGATDSHKKKLGQFFTPSQIADFLAGFAKSNQKKVRVLDPGCGIGILSAALCEKLVNTSILVREIELVAFEIDTEILPYTDKCLTYLGLWLKFLGVDFTYFLCKNDFVLHNSHILKDGHFVDEPYDIVICNPPYFKLPKDDIRISAARSIIYGQTNIYSIFMVIAARLLKPNGQLIFITPRSFCSGNYFRLFRKVFFAIVNLEVIHLFNSRTKAFKRDNVLQENIIIVARRKTFSAPGQTELSFGPMQDNKVVISSSEGVVDIHRRRTKTYFMDALLNLNSYQKVLHLPINPTDDVILEQFRQWPGSFQQYDLAISTGPIVNFRSSDIITFENEKGTVPLFWLHNVFPMQLQWPIKQGKGKPKGQFVRESDAALSRLLPNLNYVLLRRFSTKEDTSRLVAAPLLKNDMPWTTRLGIENHLNYIYHKKRELTPAEVYGLSMILNSRLFDLYFRTFNGNINVSATELRDFPLPDFALITALGNTAILKIEKKVAFDTDELIDNILKLKLTLPTV